MPNINIDQDIYERWMDLFKSKSRVEFPSLKNFTEKMMLSIIDKEVPYGRKEQAREKV